MISLIHNLVKLVNPVDLSYISSAKRRHWQPGTLKLSVVDRLEQGRCANASPASPNLGITAKRTFKAIIKTYRVSRQQLTKSLNSPSILSLKRAGGVTTFSRTILSVIG